MMKLKYNIFASIDNFTTDSDSLDFCDFKINKIEAGEEAAKWRKCLNSRDVPSYLLDYQVHETTRNPMSDFDRPLTIHGVKSNCA